MEDIYKKVLNFYKLVRNEIIMSKDLYGYEKSKILKIYYKNLLRSPKFYFYVVENYIQRVFPLIKNLKKGDRVLDMGCGLGTESLLVSFLGGDVEGVDLREGRLEIAKKRKNYYKNNFNPKMQIDFNFHNALNYNGLEKYNFIWANEAISHIHPLEKFLNNCYKNLSNDGKLFIVDANKLNPYIYYTTKMEQKKRGGIINTMKVRIGGEYKQVPYAVERIFNPNQLSNMMSNLFDVKKIYHLRFFPYFIYEKFPALSTKFNRQFLRKIPILRRFSGNYVLESIKKNL